MSYFSYANARQRSCDLDPHAASPTLLGHSPAIREVVQQLEKIARSDAPILIQGETGSGKELAARAVRHHSSRRTESFVPVNCGALPDGLVETELFGHAQGAFTDARQARPGMIAEAQRGTLFLDEVDTLSPKAQVTLLRYLQDKRYRPVGVSHEVASDVRVIAASNQPLQRLVDDGGFRRDLLYRLNIFEVTIPPLRNREEDIEVLARHFISHFSAVYAMPVKELHPETLRWMRQHDWPGNVRELENWIHRELLLADGDQIRPRGIVRDQDPASWDGRAVGPQSMDYRTAKARALASFERAYASRVIAEARGSVTTAARLAGTERRSFGRLLKKHGIDRRFYSA